MFLHHVVGQVILTRINPNRKETSMIIRPRPGWEDLRAFLAGENEPLAPGCKPKLRCECSLERRKQWARHGQTVTMSLPTPHMT